MAQGSEITQKQTAAILLSAREPLIPGVVETEPSAARKRFFLKKEAKTFAHWCARRGSVYLV
jgi:hypothetical protein